MKIGRRLAIKILNASKFALHARRRPRIRRAVTEPLDRALLADAGRRRARGDGRARRLRLHRARSRRPRRSSGRSATTTSSWSRTGRTAAAATPRPRRRKATLATALSVQLRLFAPFLPFVTEEVWSWWQDGSVHRAAWPTAEALEAVADGVDAAILRDTSTVLIGGPQGQVGGQDLDAHRRGRRLGHRLAGDARPGGAGDRRPQGDRAHRRAATSPPATDPCGSPSRSDRSRLDRASPARLLGKPQGLGASRRSPCGQPDADGDRDEREKPVRQEHGQTGRRQLGRSGLRLLRDHPGQRTDAVRQPTRPGEPPARARPDRCTAPTAHPVRRPAIPVRCAAAPTPFGTPAAVRYPRSVRCRPGLRPGPLPRGASRRTADVGHRGHLCAGGLRDSRRPGRHRRPGVRQPARQGGRGGDDRVDAGADQRHVGLDECHPPGPAQNRILERARLHLLRPAGVLHLHRRRQHPRRRRRCRQGQLAVQRRRPR